MLFHNILQLEKLNGADFKYEFFFSKILAQKYLNKAFLVRNLGIFVFSQNFASRKIRGCWYQIWQNCFQISAQKYINQAFFVPNLGIFVFFYCKIWEIDKSEDADFISDNSCFKNFSQKYPNKVLVPNLSSFDFSRNFAIRQIEGCWFQIWQICFQIPEKKYRNQGFLVPD